MGSKMNTRPRTWLGSGAALAVLTLATNAVAQPSMYVGAHLGQNNLSGWPAEVDFGGVTAQGRLGLEDGAHGGVMIGRQIDNAYRYDVEYQQGRLDISSVSLGPVSRANSARGKYQALMLNGYRTFVLRPNLNLYAGAGIGWGSVKLPSLPPLNGCNCFTSASDKGFAFQVRAGAEYELSLGHRLFLQYTALRLAGSGSDTVPSVNYGRKTVSAITAGYRMNF